nr:KH domain-containing protein HEN4-like [Ipomoea batatas]
MSVKLTPSKRPHDRSITENNDRGKWQKSAGLGSEKSPLKTSTPSKFLRVLCPISRIGFITGEDGNILPEIGQATGAEVRVEEAIPGCDERVVVVVGSGNNDGAESEQHEAKVEETDTKDTDNEMAVNDGNGESKHSAEVEDSKLRREISAIQEALLCLFERMAKEDLEKDRGDDEGNNSSFLTLRLLIFSSQVNCLMGKGGSVLKQMSSESGAEIHILAREKLPLCASSSDDLVQISGQHGAVKKAIESISQQLLESSPLEQDPLPANASGPSSQPFGHRSSSQDSHPRPNNPFNGPRPPYSTGYHDGETGFRGQMNPPQDALTFRLLCPDEKVGGVIGKGGSIIKTIQHETGCEIQVLEGAADSEDRIIAISGSVHPHDRISPPQDAVLRVQSRIFRALPESKDNTMLAKLLVSSNQIGCLLGKGGSIIAEMRKSTGAYIRILGKDQTPNCASENEEVVQVNGEFDTVQEALFQITSRLQEHFFRDAFPSMNRPTNPRFLDHIPPFPSYRGRRELSPAGMYPSMGPPFHQFDGIGGLPPRGGFHPHDDRPPYMPNFHRSGVRPPVSERMPSSGPWVPQGLIDGGGPMGMPDYAAGPQRRIGGFGGGSPAIITSTKVEVVVPRSVVPEIYGDGGGCLRQICEISDAKVIINDPKPGATEAMIIISGTPEQTNAAQSLIQAFVMLETEAA